jgi:O-Antigen ligase
MMATAVSALSSARLPEAAPESDVRQAVKGFVLIGGALCALCLILPILYALIIAIPILVIWFWRAPVRGVYLLTAGAALIEIFPLNFPDSLTDRIPLFLNLNNSAGIPFPITPAEILMITLGLVALARGASDRSLHWPDGRLVTPYCLYLVIVLGAEIHGLVAGGDFKTSLWEMRPQVYGFILFFMATTLIETRAQVVRLAVIFLLAVSVKALIGDYRYFVTLQGILSHEDIFAHEDSYFLGMFVTATLAATVWLKNRRLQVLMGVMSVLVLVAMLANSRRAGVYALAVAGGVIVLLAFRFEPSLRKRIGWLSVALVIAGAVFISTAWDKQYGVQAQLVRPIRSLVDPSARDYSSDQYRVAETANLQLTFRTSPIVGVGFGSPFLVVYPMADISGLYSLWNVIPHNSLMWVGMRMGALGFGAFWALIGLAVLEGCHVLATKSDPLLRTIAAFAIAAVVGEIVVGYADIQLENYRNLIFLGVVLGVLNRLSQLPEAEHV